MFAFASVCVFIGICVHVCVLGTLGTDNTLWKAPLPKAPSRDHYQLHQLHFSSVQLLSCVWLFSTPCTAAPQASLSIMNSRSLLKLMSIELVMPSSHLILCRPLLLLPSSFPSIRVFSSKSVLCIRWPKYWSFSFSISPSNEYSGLISFKMDWLDLLAVQGTLKSLLQHYSSKLSILWHSAFFLVQLSIHLWLLEKPKFWLDRPLLVCMYTHTHTHTHTLIFLFTCGKFPLFIVK